MNAEGQKVLYTCSLGGKCSGEQMSIWSQKNKIEKLLIFFIKTLFNIEELMKGKAQMQ